MRFLKFLLVSLVIITVLGFVSLNGNAVILPTTTAPGITPTTFMLPTTPAFTPTFGGGALTALMVAPTPTFAPGIIGGGIGLWPTALMFTGTPPVPTTAAAFPAAMLAPTPTVTPTFGGGLALTPFMVTPTPTVTPTFGGGLALTPFMVTPTPTTGGGGTAFWPTALMLPATTPAPGAGALFPIAMPPVI